MPPSSMRAVTCTGPDQLALEERPIPEPGPGEVRVKLRGCGICGSDLSLLPIGYMGSRITPGHEMTAVVDELGEGVSGFAIGDTIAVEPIKTCGRCHTCLSGRDAVCPDIQFLGVHIDGGFADYLTVPARRLFAIDARLPIEVSAMAEPMAVVVHALKRANFSTGQRVLVLGAGNLGLLTVVAARALGAEDVWITARHPHQAALAEKLGAGRVFREPDATPEKLAVLGREHPIDCAIETVGGQAETLPLAVAALRPGGVVSVVGLFTGKLELNPFALFQKEVTLAWSNCYDHPHEGTDFENAIRILTEHHRELGDVTSHQLGLDEIQRGFELAADKRSGTVKVTILN